MSNAKILKATCALTGRRYCIELGEFDGEWRAVNMIDLDEDTYKIIQSEVKIENLKTNKSLIPCSDCGSRTVGGCDCAKGHHVCSKGMKYQFDCIYCKDFKIDYTRASARSPYTRWAGISNIPDAVKDKYGNPNGSQYDLAEDGSFQGYTVIVFDFCRTKRRSFNIDQPKAALKKKGFTVIEYTSVPKAEELAELLSDDKAQLWVISGDTVRFRDEHRTVIKKFYDTHHGIYLWGDDYPFFADANAILDDIARGSCLFGESRGDKVVGIQTAPGLPGIIADHPITTGIVNLYEGISISHVLITQQIKPLIFGTNGQIISAYIDNSDCRAIIDGGFTRLYFKWDSAGTDRYIVNAAAWLANTEYFGY